MIFTLLGWLVLKGREWVVLRSQWCHGFPPLLLLGRCQVDLWQRAGVTHRYGHNGTNCDMLCTQKSQITFEIPVRLGASFGIVFSYITGQGKPWALVFSFTSRTATLSFFFPYFVNTPFHSRHFDMLLVIEQALQITLTTPLFCPSAPLNHDILTESQHEWHQDPESETAKWSLVIFGFIVTPVLFLLWHNKTRLSLPNSYNKISQTSFIILRDNLSVLL